MTDIAIALLLLASALGLVIGLKYLVTQTFFPYHAQVVGKQWPDLDQSVRVIILGMLRIIGGGFITLSATLAWLSYAIWRGSPWAPWAILTIAALGIGPALFVAINLRSIRPGAKSPVGPLIAGLALIIIAVGFALLFPKP